MKGVSMTDTRLTTEPKPDSGADRSTEEHDRQSSAGTHLYDEACALCNRSTEEKAT
jgi:hypothetical protein